MNVLLVVAGLGLVFIAYGLATLYQSRSARSPGADANQALRLRFNNVFAMMTDQRRSAMLAGLQRKHDLDLEGAMHKALDQRDTDTRSWRT